MTSRYLVIGSLALLTTVTSAAAVSRLPVSGERPDLTSTRARLLVSGSRSEEQRRDATADKLDSVLADLSRHAARARPGHVLADLHALSPAARFVQNAPNAPALVLIDATARGNPQTLLTALAELGLEHAAVYANDVSGWLPVNQID